MAFRLSSQADADLLDLWAFVAGEAGEERADAVVDAITDACWMLSHYPKVGRLRPEFGPDLRSFPTAGCVIYYRPGQVVLIARILHGRRDQAAAWTGQE
jgi:toxin ParE1/3/4